MKIAALKALVVSRLTLVAIFFSILLTLFSIAYVTPVHAQTPCPDTSSVGDTIDDINRVGIAANNYDDKYFNLNQMAGTTDSLLSLLTGCSQLHPETNDLTAGTGALASTGRLVATLYGAPPVSGVTYFAQQIQKFNPVQPAYAQEEGIGFKALEPVQKVWTAFRNIAYAGFVIIFVIMGFMIMFRSHISPQAVATIQDSIPRLVVALGLVTFSYAIAGLMIDVMFVVLNVIINTLESQNLLSSGGGDYVFKKSVFGAIFESYPSIIRTVFEAIFRIIDDLIKVPAFDKILGFFGGAIVTVIVAVALIFLMFRIFWVLLKAYVTIIILTLFAPFFFLLQALPGNNSAKEWFKQMAASVAAFPAIAFMFILAGIIGGIGSTFGAGGLGGSEATKFSPQDIGQFPLLWGDLNIQDVGQLIALGFLFMAPEAPELVKKALGVTGPPIGVPPTLAGAAGAVGGAGRYAWSGGGPLADLRKQRQAEEDLKRQREARRKLGLPTTF